MEHPPAERGDNYAAWSEEGVKNCRTDLDFFARLNDIG
jgi:hypothetical protein